MGRVDMVWVIGRGKHSMIYRKGKYVYSQLRRCELYVARNGTITIAEFFLLSKQSTLFLPSALLLLALGIWSRSGTKYLRIAELVAL